MNITKGKVKDMVLTISIEVEQADYDEKVGKVLQDYRKTVQIPGFRKGKCPLGIIKKKYGRSVLVDEVNKILQDELYKYITAEKLKVLGSPLPIEKQLIDWDVDKDFNFKYELGLAPDFNVSITSKDKLNYYKIKADTKLVDSYCNDIAKRYGKMSTVDISRDGDLILCTIEQLDVDGNIMQNGIKNDATVSMDYISEKKIKNKFIGVQVADVLTLNVVKAFKNRSDIAAMLNVDKLAITNLDMQEFQFTIKNINRLIPADLNKELFDKVYEPGLVKTKNDFKAKVKSESEEHLVVESDRMFKNDVVTYLLDKLKLDMPNDFLKKWLVKTSEQPITMDMLENEYDQYAKSLQWQLIENKILELYNVKVTEDDVLVHAKKLIGIQMRQYGQTVGDDKQLTEIANNILKNETEKKKIYDQLYDKRTLVVYKDNFKLNEKSISYDDFVKLASEK
ncbi:MAG: trigger factor [Flavobacteriales bacterium]|nr:trigger factor [Flavobacteriales bacterium]